MVQAALTNAQQNTVAFVLELDPILPNAYKLLKVEVIRLRERSSWDSIIELFTMLPLGTQ